MEDETKTREKERLRERKKERERETDNLRATIQARLITTHCHFSSGFYLLDRDRQSRLRDQFEQNRFPLDRKLPFLVQFSFSDDEHYRFIQQS